MKRKSQTLFHRNIDIDTCHLEKYYMDYLSQHMLTGHGNQDLHLIEFHNEMSLSSLLSVLRCAAEERLRRPLLSDTQLSMAVRICVLHLT